MAYEQPVRDCVPKDQCGSSCLALAFTKAGQSLNIAGWGRNQVPCAREEFKRVTGEQIGINDSILTLSKILEFHELTVLLQWAYS